MTALANLAKFHGCYDKWLDIRRRYSLKWSKGDSLQAFERFFNPELTFDVMLQRVRGMIRMLPARMAAVVRFACLTGLRPAEACESVRLLNITNVKINIGDIQAQYYNPERQALEHFRFPAVFLRHTKNAYISFVTREQLSGIGVLSCETPSWDNIRLACLKVGIAMDMRYCRRIFASYLSQCGIQSEVVDFLQGRVSSSVFSRHYLTPGAGLKDKVLLAVSELAGKLDG
jgi:intergrase/recombinase